MSARFFLALLFCCGVVAACSSHYLAAQSGRDDVFDRVSRDLDQRGALLGPVVDLLALADHVLQVEQANLFHELPVLGVVRLGRQRGHIDPDNPFDAVGVEVGQPAVEIAPGEPGRRSPCGWHGC